MANFVSPGVYTIEKDVSDYAPSLNPSIVGLVGFASRGPVDKATLITTPADLLRTFGTPDLVTGGQGIFGALEILQKTNQVYYVRAATSERKEANNVLSLATAPHAAVNMGSMSSNIVYRFDCQAFDKAGVQAGDKTEVYVYRERPYVSGVEGASPYPTTPSGSWTNADWNQAFAAGFGNAFDPATGQLSFIPSGYGAASGLVVARETGAQSNRVGSYFTVDTFISSGSLEDNFYEDTYLSATPIDVTDLTFTSTSKIDYEMRAASGTTKDTGTNWGDFSGATTSAIYNIWQGVGGPEDNFLTVNNFSGGGVGITDITVQMSGSLALGMNAPSGVSFITSGQQGGYQLASLYPGLGYNYSAINYAGGLQYRGLQYEVVNKNNGRSDVIIKSDGGTEESYEMGLWKPLSTTSATSVFPEDVLNKGLDNAVSQYVKGNFYNFDISTFLPTSLAGNDLAFSATVSGIPLWVSNIAENFGDENTFVGTYMGGLSSTANYVIDTSKTFRCLTFEEQTALDAKGGKNGDASDYGGDMSNAKIREALVGSTGLKTGMQALDSEAVDVTIAAVPGVTDQNVQNELISLAETTQNFLAVVSPPVGFTNSQMAIDWTNGKATGRTASINSSYAAVYWPWLKQFDAYTGADRWYDPSIYAIGQMCYTDEVADPWFAPAGLTRGRLTKPVDVEVTLGQGDRDALYGPGNIVNPITKFTTDGIVIYGQKTAQRAATALDRINVRRMMIFLRRLVLTSTRRFVFEPNDPVTWEAVRNVLSPALADIQQRRGITSFKVVCDATTNTPLRVDRNELWCKVIIKPTKTAEMLVFELNLTNQSASV